eukprot:Transcript_8043.p2 GENE.Transcript_8043~~Transcript_8043.p2  ORF type:complete len:107 (+),score=29.77 Transcript_8043:61-381(+)
MNKKHDDRSESALIEGAFVPFINPAFCSRCGAEGEALTRCPNCPGGGLLQKDGMVLRAVPREEGQYDEDGPSVDDDSGKGENGVDEAKGGAGGTTTSEQSAARTLR